MTVAVSDPSPWRSPAGRALHDDAYYWQAVSQLADQQEVVAHEAIYSDTGVKLVDKGGRIDRKTYERLLQNRLVSALDAQLTTRNLVDIRTLETEVLMMSVTTTLGRLLVQQLGAQEFMLLEALRHMAWPASASFKLTVMRHQRPELYVHSVSMMMVAVFLAVKSGWEVKDCADTAAAALLHDVGMLFMPPSWSDPKHQLTTLERKHLEAHSITAVLVVRAARVYEARIEEAVLEHHERMDGTGYPRQLTGPSISPMGRVLMMAEVVSAFYAKFSDMPSQRLSLMLRMNHNRFDAQLTEVVHALIAQDSAPAVAGQPSTQQVRQIVATLAAMFQNWVVAKRQLPEQWQGLASARAAVYIDMRLEALEKSMAQAGCHPRAQASWIEVLESDAHSMQELVMINREALWQIESCVQACLRRWPQLMQPSNPLEQVLQQWLSSSRQVLQQMGTCTGRCPEDKFGGGASSHKR